MMVGTLLMTICLGLTGCQKVKSMFNKAVNKEEAELTTKHFKMEGSSTYQNAEAKLTLDMDYPEGDSKAAIVLRRWIYEKAMDEPCTEDLKDPQQLWDKLLAKYKKENSPESIKAALEDGIGEEWFYNIRFKKEWENENVVSYTYSADAFNPGNATSGAWIMDYSICKADGRTLGWEMFKSKDEVKHAIDELLIAKYGADGADMYDQGIPMPDAPLFLGNGVRFDYGNYSIGTPHYYEEMGEYPCCILNYDTYYKDLLTNEACKLLGLSSNEKQDNNGMHIANQTSTAPNDAYFIGLLKSWDDMHSLKHFDDYENCPYTEVVRFYGQTMNGQDAARQVQAALLKMPDFRQKSDNVRITRLNEKRVRLDFDKHTTHAGQDNFYPSYLVLAEEDGGIWRIAEESDLVTDRNLAKRRNQQ